MECSGYLLLQQFCKMRLGIDRLNPITTPLYGFTGHSVIPEGIIELPLMSIDEYPRQATMMTNFLVIKGPTFYAAIERPALKDLKTVTSIYYLAIKFPTMARLGMERGNQVTAYAVNFYNFWRLYSRIYLFLSRIYCSLIHINLVSILKP